MITKDALFEDYFVTLAQVIPVFEDVFSVTGAWPQVMGVADRSYPFDTKTAQAASKHVKASTAWRRLSDLYDYAVEGSQPDGLDATSIVINGAEVLSLIETENHSPSDAWRRIVRLGDGRFALDDGTPVVLDKLALLANVDERTVRNAISAGELQSSKEGGVIFIENGSARNWLSGRRLYKPTKLVSASSKELAHIATPPELGAFLSARRQALGLSADARSADAKTIAQLEDGTFALQLDAVFPLADFYQLDRAALLTCVMRTFFRDQLALLTETIKSKSA